MQQITESEFLSLLHNKPVLTCRYCGAKLGPPMHSMQPEHLMRQVYVTYCKGSRAQHALTFEVIEERVK